MLTLVTFETEAWYETVALFYESVISLYASALAGVSLNRAVKQICCWLETCVVFLYAFLPLYINAQASESTSAVLFQLHRLLYYYLTNFLSFCLSYAALPPAAVYGLVSSGNIWNLLHS